ncbi:MAG: 2-hydroxyacyl-CoA dehydratase [Chloroflexi bacterium]|nr:2-hydroxyacyl-CoA dehydratase [Chloroflexota bacterium]
MFIDEQIEKLARRLKNIERNPSPGFLKCNKIRYEVELEHFLHVREAWREGKPFAILENIEQLVQPLGLENQYYISWGDRVTEPQRYYNIAVSRFGFPEHTCDRTMTALGLLLSGEVPIPRIIISRRLACDPERWSLMSAAKFTGTLFFEVDRRNSCDEENLRSLGEQLAELIEFVEKSIPQAKYDEEKLLRLLEMDQQALEYRQRTYELRKRVPCPISPQDSFRLMNIMPSHYPSSAKVLEYCRMYHDEMFERAEKGIGGVPEERLRIAWLATGPFGRSTFDLLSRKGVSLPWFHNGGAPYFLGVLREDYGDESNYGRRLTPLEEVVRRWNINVWGGSGDMWVNSLMKVCRELKIDAVVDFLQPGCVTTKNLKRITAERLRNELGIPTLDLEGREFFATEMSQIEMNRKLEEFLEMCIANKSRSGHAT